MGNDPVNYVDPSGLESCECKVYNLTNMSDEQRKKFQNAIAKRQSIIEASRQNTPHINIPQGVAIDGKYASKLAFGRTQAGLQAKIDTAKNAALWAGGISALIDQSKIKHPYAKWASKALGVASACMVADAHLLQKEKDGKLDQAGILTDLYTNSTDFIKKHPLIEFGVDEATSAASSEVFGQ